MPLVAQDRVVKSAHTAPAAREAIGLLPVIAVIVYPFLLDAFHAVVGSAGQGDVTAACLIGATFLLAGVFAIPFLAILVANRPAATAPTMRRLAFLCVAAPALYVFLGVVNYMAGSAYPDELLWCAFWLATAVWAWFGRSTIDNRPPDVARGRVGHGLVAVAAALFVLFHVTSHLFFLGGQTIEMEVMKFGERVYRAPAVEILLVFVMVFLCFSGGYLAWRWSAAETRHDFFRTFQIASGVYLLMYVVGHMDSVFIYARLFLGVPTDWKFATGAPAGMIHDPWNIRLLPHYALGVFFVLAHMATGARGIALAHGMDEWVANRLWWGATACAGLVAVAVIVGMVRVAAGSAPV